MKKILLHIFIICLPLSLSAQKFVSDNGDISFFSDAALEDISAVNKKVVSIFNIETNDIVFSIPVAEFKFEQSLMEEHFNEKYLETDKYPKSTFQGVVENFIRSAQGVQQVKAKGKLTLHGVTHDVEIPGTLEFQNGQWLLQSKFVIKLKDYKVEIPQLLWQKIAEAVMVTLNVHYKPK